MDNPPSRGFTKHNRNLKRIKRNNCCIFFSYHSFVHSLTQSFIIYLLRTLYIEYKIMQKDILPTFRESFSVF